MADQPESRRLLLSLEAVDPSSGKALVVLISSERLQTVAKRSLGHASEAAFIVPVILQKPTAIFEGLRWDEDEDRRGAGEKADSDAPGLPIDHQSRFSRKLL